VVRPDIKRILRLTTHVSFPSPQCTEYNILQRSLDKVSDEIAGKDVKLKWVQSKLDKEIETNRQLSDRLQAVEEKQASQVEEASRLKFSEDSQRLFLQEIDVLKKKNQAMTEENNALSLKVSHQCAINDSNRRTMVRSSIVGSSMRFFLILICSVFAKFGYQR
jgi:hypothetical protein